MACEDEAPCINSALPREILTYIGSILVLDQSFHNKKDGHLERFMQVCREWRSIGREAANNLQIDCSRHGEDAEEHASRLLSFFPHVEDLYLRPEDKSTMGVSERVVRSVDQMPVHIKHLEISLYYPAPPLRLIPDAIGRWDWLESLDLGNAYTLGSMSRTERWIHLKSLTLSYCDAFPQASSRWTSLQVLKVDSLNVEELPDAARMWRDLRSLQLGTLFGSNRTCPKLQRFPPFVGLWDKLEVLSLREASCFDSLPPAVSTWTNLRKLTLTSCPRLEALPAEVGAWHSLQTLVLEEVGLFALPPSVGLWNSLQELSLSSCAKLSGLPLQVEGWERLRKFTLYSCSGFCSLPEAAGGWKELQDLSIERCAALKGLPKRVDCWTALRRINISHCGQLRYLPEEVKRWTSLETVSLGKNLRMRGLLQKAPNEFEGETISTTSIMEQVQLKFWGALVHLTLSNTKLETLPDAVEDWSLLQTVTIQSCASFGSLPSGVEGWKNLRRLRVTDCNLLTKLPREVRGWEQLQEIELTSYESNSPWIDLPLEVGAWVNVQEVHIKRVESLPQSTQRWTNLTCLIIGALKADQLPEQAVAGWTK